MNFCSNCGSANIHLSVPIGDNIKRLVCESCSEIHYVNPKIIAGCLVYKNNEVLLAKRNIEPRYNLWNLTCGFMELNESLSEAAVRETLEETEASVKIERLFCTYSLPSKGQVYMVFLATMLDGHFATTPESNAVEFFNEDNIPWNDLAFGSSKYALKAFFNQLKDKSLALSQPVNGSA